jgi:hypothetical protein
VVVAPSDIPCCPVFPQNMAEHGEHGAQRAMRTKSLPRPRHPAARAFVAQQSTTWQPCPASQSTGSARSPAIVLRECVQVKRDCSGHVEESLTVHHLNSCRIIVGGRPAGSSARLRTRVIIRCLRTRACLCVNWQRGQSARGQRHNLAGSSMFLQCLNL